MSESKAQKAAGLYRTSKSTVTVATKLTHAERDALQTIVDLTDTNRAAALREAFLMIYESPEMHEEYMKRLNKLTMVNGRTR